MSRSFQTLKNAAGFATSWVFHLKRSTTGGLAEFGVLACVAGGMALAKPEASASPSASPHSQRGFAAHLSAPPPYLNLFRGYLQYRQLRRLSVYILYWYMKSLFVRLHAFRSEIAQNTRPIYKYPKRHAWSITMTFYGLRVTIFLTGSDH